MLSSATIIGRTHRLHQQNCHDFACTGEPGSGYAFGLVLDGCGSKYRDEGRVVHSHNEIGAKLLGQFAAGFLTQKLVALNETGTADPIESAALLRELHDGSLRFMRRLLDALPFVDEHERTRFVASRLLCTLVGFLVTPEAAAFFWSGDGYLCQDRRITWIGSHNNQPEYLAYQLLSHRPEPSQATAGFHIEKVEDFGQTNWLAVATDGWCRDLLHQLATPRSSLALQRWVNQKARKRDRFEDDGAASVWWRSREDPEAKS